MSNKYIKIITALFLILCFIVNTNAQNIIINPDFEDHTLFDGVEFIFGTLSEAYMSVNSPVMVVATYNSNNMIAVREDDGKGRVVFDTSFVRFSSLGWRNPPRNF